MLVALMLSPLLGGLLAPLASKIAGPAGAYLVSVVSLASSLACLVCCLLVTQGTPQLSIDS